MAQCPVCHNELPDDFGLIDCGSCRTPLFVQLDGSVTASTADPSDQPPPLESLPEDTVPNSSVQFAEMAMSDLEEPPPDWDSPAPTEPVLEESPIELPPVEPAEAAALPPEEPNIDAILDSQEPPPPVMTREPPPDLNDLSSLANSVENPASRGVLRYAIEVSGIDTADIRNDFREVISDRRFLWDVDGIVKSIRSGSVMLEDVSAVKALLLVHRLRSLPVRVQWEQHVLHES